MLLALSREARKLSLLGVGLILTAAGGDAGGDEGVMEVAACEARSCVTEGVAVALCIGKECGEGVGGAGKYLHSVHGLGNEKNDCSGASN